MAKVQKTSTVEFKREAVQLAQTRGKPIAQVARELGISDTSIHQWRKELALAEHVPEAFPGSGHQAVQEEEVRRLKCELELVKQEREILKRGMLLGSTTGNERRYTEGERSQRQDGVIAFYALERG